MPKGVIWGLTGCEGGGKSAYMTYLLLKHSQLGGVVYAFEGYELYDARGNVISKLIDVDGWLNMPALLENEDRPIAIGIDEIQNILDSQRHMTLFNRLSGYIGAQRRKYAISIFYTVQNWQWLYDRFRWLTHLLSSCYDLRWSDYGKEQGYQEGDRSSIRTWDCKGMFSGEAWSELQQYNFRTREMWPHYRSFTPTDIYAGFTKVEIINKRHIVDLRDTSDVLPNEPPDEVKAEIAARSRMPSEFIGELVAGGKLNPAELGKLRNIVSRGA